MKDVLAIGFNVPFKEAIKAAKKRKVVLPEVYYGELQGVARQKAFSVAGLACLDQLQAVKDSLDTAMANGLSFEQWKQDALTIQGFDLPRHRLDNIFRTNLQGSYMAGRWEQFKRNRDSRPFLMYDAINDSRVRPSHLALDNVIRPITDKFWQTHSPPNGYRCRCSLISLTESQAKKRSNGDKGLNNPATLEDGTKAMPDKGWEYSPADRLDGVNTAIKKKTEPYSKMGAALEKKIVTEIKKGGKAAEYIEQKTAQKVAQFLEENDIVDKADFGRIKDVAIANAYGRAMFDAIKEFPKLRKNQKFTGSIQAHNRYFVEKRREEYIKKLIAAGHTKDDAIYWAEKSIKAIKITDNRIAQSRSGSIMDGIAHNEMWGTIVRLEKALSNGVKTKWSPEGTGKVKAVVDHELGHQLDALLNLSRDQTIIDAWKELSKNKTIMTNEVSGYAYTNIAEFIAECWSEYKNNPTPRATARFIGGVIEKRYKADSGR